MIQINRNPAAAHQDIRIKIVGLGGTGSNVLDRLLLDGIRDAELIAMNTDVQALTASVVEHKVQLGRTATRGLGAGGDPEIGYAAAEEGVDEIRQSIAGAQMVFICAGLGGGTGSGAARIVAAMAREQNALVVSFATLPFAFEGKRRRQQAEEALSALQRYSDVVIHFQNDRMSDAVAPLAGIQEAFASADQTLSQSIRAIVQMVRQKGLVNVGFDEIATALRIGNEVGAHCIFGYGEADGDNRAHDALSRALKNPLMDRGRMLEDARNVLINVTGGPSMTLDEVQILMEEFNRHISDQTRLLFGAAVDPSMGQRISVTIVSALHSAVAPVIVESTHRVPARVETSPVSVAPVPAVSTPSTEASTSVRRTESDATPKTAEPQATPAEPMLAITQEPSPAPPTEREASPEPVRAVEVEPSLGKPQAQVPPQKAQKGKSAQAKQEQMQFEPVTRGRFEKSEPTIVDGQDLDVPTFLRRNVKVR